MKGRHNSLHHSAAGKGAPGKYIQMGGSQTVMQNRNMSRVLREEEKDQGFNLNA